MTEQKETGISRLAEEILSLAKAQLLVKYRFLDRALYALKTQETDLLPLATDGDRLYYEPKSLLTVYRAEQGYAVRAYGHILLHCIFRHMFVGPGVEDSLWDLACDIAAEAVLMDLQLRQVQALSGRAERQSILNALSPQIKPLTAEKLYRWLLDHRPSEKQQREWQALFAIDDHLPWHIRAVRVRLQAAGTQGTSGHEDGGDSAPENTAAVTAMWRDISEQIRTDLETFGQQRGDLPGNMLQQLRAVNREKCDYRQFLKKFAARTEVMRISPDEFDYAFYTYGLSLYKDMPLIEPLEYRDDRRIRELVIAIDTSGSVAGEKVQMFLQKTFTILKQEETFDRRFMLHIIQCDADIQEAAVITSQQEFDRYLQHMTIKGLGGTDFRPVFAFVEKLRREKQIQRLGGLLYFTDGYGVFPERMPDYRTAFIFLEKDDFIFPQVPPWAIRVVLEENDITVFGSPRE
ncbi:MAG: VWA-like domain-containing protein [Clostridiales bacterium]|nr:VWA-like domain-containing protein [Clostridiales bacterium]